MINEQKIISIFQGKRRYEAELSILRDCMDMLYESEQNQYADKYALLKRKLALIDHWLSYLPNDERILVEKHLIEGLAWSRISSQIVNQEDVFIPCDERTLQRLQEKAVKRIHTFMQESFAGLLDDLVENEDK